MVISPARSRLVAIYPHGVAQIAPGWGFQILFCSLRQLKGKQEDNELSYFETLSDAGKIGMIREPWSPLAAMEKTVTLRHRHEAGL